MLKRKNLLHKTVPFILIGLLAFVLYLVFMVNINEMIAVIRQTNFNIYLLSFVATLAEMFFFALAWHYFLVPLSTSMSFKKVFLYSWIGNFIDLLVPAESVSGEISRVYFVSHEGVDAGKVVVSVLMQRVFGMLLNIGALTISALYLLILKASLPSLIQNLVLLVVVTTSLFLILFLVLCFKENWMLKLVDKIFDKVIVFLKRVSGKRWNLDEWKERTAKSVKTFYKALKVLSTNPKKLILPVIFSIFAWFFSIVTYYLVFAAMGYTISLATLIIVHSLVIALKSVPVGIPAEVGVTEIAMTTLFGAFNMSLDVSAAATVLIRIVTVWFRLVIGFGVVQWVGLRGVLENKNFVGREDEATS